MATTSLSARILHWHEQADRLPLRTYRGWALAQLCEEIRCRRGFWGIGCARTDTVHDLLQHPVTEKDSETPSEFAQPASGRLSEWLDASALARLHFAVREPQSGLTTFIAVEREAGEEPFSPSERIQFEALAPHLFAAWRRCLQLQLYSKCAADGGAVAALVDRQGFLHVADGRFYSLLRRAWPQWGGRQLPWELLQIAATADDRLLAGTRWNATHMGSLIYLAGRPLGALGLLKAREQQIALAIVAGASQREMAVQFEISPFTVRNTTTRIYRKLGVRNRQGLARRLQAFEPVGRPFNETAFPSIAAPRSGPALADRPHVA